MWFQKNFDLDMVGHNVLTNLPNIKSGTFRLHPQKLLTWMLLDCRADGATFVDDWEMELQRIKSQLSQSSPVPHLKSPARSCRVGSEIVGVSSTSMSNLLAYQHIGMLE